MQPIDEIEKSYEKPDPWGYQTNPEDIKRKRYILGVLDMLDKSDFQPYFTKDKYSHYPKMIYGNALDVGCGEGWITEHLPAFKIYGHEVSSNATRRFPANVLNFTQVVRVKPKFDLIIATGVMYHHYNFKRFLDIIKDFSDKNSHVLICSIKEWEVHEVNGISDKVLIDLEFPYKTLEQLTQRLRVFQI